MTLAAVVRLVGLAVVVAGGGGGVEVVLHRAAGDDVAVVVDEAGLPAVATDDEGDVVPAPGRAELVVGQEAVAGDQGVAVGLVDERVFAAVAQERDHAVDRAEGIGRCGTAEDRVELEAVTGSGVDRIGLGVAALTGQLADVVAAGVVADVALSERRLFTRRHRDLVVEDHHSVVGGDDDAQRTGGDLQREAAVGGGGRRRTTDAYGRASDGIAVAIDDDARDRRGYRCLDELRQRVERCVEHLEREARVVHAVAAVVVDQVPVPAGLDQARIGEVIQRADDLVALEDVDIVHAMRTDRRAVGERRRDRLAAAELAEQDRLDLEDVGDLRCAIEVDRAALGVDLGDEGEQAVFDQDLQLVHGGVHTTLHA